MNFIVENNIHGIDIDWETPASNEATNFTLLMKAIYEKVKAYNKNYLVTAAIGGGKWQPPKYDLPNSKDYLDYVNLMTYSMATGNGYYQNALFKSTKGATLTSCTIEESIKIFNDYGSWKNVLTQASVGTIGSIFGETLDLTKLLKTSDKIFIPISGKKDLHLMKRLYLNSFNFLYLSMAIV